MAREVDPRLASIIEQLDAQCEDLFKVERVSAPMMLGTAHSLKSQGFDEYATQIRKIALFVAGVASRTRGLLEQLDTLTDPRLEHTDPRIPPPPDHGSSEG